MKIIALSDLHGQLPEIPKDTELLLIGGDICPTASHSKQFQKNWLDMTFRKWLDKIECPIVATWGNHDFIGEYPDLVPKLKWHLLVDESVELLGLKIYGSPWQLRFFDWAFNLDESDLAKKWALIPEDTDVIVLHSPVYGYGDDCPRKDGSIEHVGSPSLLEIINNIKPKLVVFGHIHNGRGMWTNEHGTIIANVSMVNNRYEMIYSPMNFSV
jgi:Icc-related predicted phosphoesterase